VSISSGQLFTSGSETNASKATPSVLYRDWLDADPRWGFGWIGWASCYLRLVCEETGRLQEARDFARQAKAFGAPSPPSPARKAKAGRNEPCPCGSGKKYKQCCLFNQAGM
jgi:hypothetical protein